MPFSRNISPQRTRSSQRLFKIFFLGVLSVLCGELLCFFFHRPSCLSREARDPKKTPPWIPPPHFAGAGFFKRNNEHPTSNVQHRVLNGKNEKTAMVANLAVGIVLLYHGLGLGLRLGFGLALQLGSGLGLGRGRGSGQVN